MQTPYLPKAIFGDYFRDVYEPAEDTFLLLDALENDLDLLKTNTSICLECGSGSGTVITALSNALNSSQRMSCICLATDININACKTTLECSRYHKQGNSLQAIRTDLAESLVDRLAGSVDLLVFNPPYVPTDADEISDGTHGELARSWAGGYRGRHLIDRFLKHYVPRLLSKPNGVAYMVALDKNNLVELTHLLQAEHNINGKIVMQRRAGIENLHVVRYGWITS